MAVSDSHKNGIKLTPAFSNPTIPVGRQIEKETGGGGREGGFSSINPTIIIYLLVPKKISGFEWYHI